MKSFSHLVGQQVLVLCLFLIFMGSVFILLPAPIAQATDLTVTNNNDSGPGSLRNAISLASSGDTILFSLAPPAVITLSSQLEITKSLVISGPGESLLTISGNNTTRVMTVSTGITLSLLGVTIANGNTSGFGGGIYNSPSSTLILTNTRFLSNTATLDGGGISNRGTIKVTNSTLSNNRVTSSILNNGCVGGGGICNYNATATIENSTLSRNDASGFNSSGGAIAHVLSSLTIQNSTFFSNSAAYVGGGIASIGFVTVTNSTFSSNSAVSSGGGFSMVPFGSVLLRNTIIADNAPGGNCNGTFTNGGNNIDSGSTCGWTSTNGSMSNTDPLLAPLANNGGPTMTMALLFGSPAIDGVTYNPPCNGSPLKDQRGFVRPFGLRCDIGSYERTLSYLFLPFVTK